MYGESQGGLLENQVQRAGLESWTGERIPGGGVAWKTVADVNWG